MYRAPPQSTEKHFILRPSYDISQYCAYGCGGELSPSCQWLDIFENTLESAVTMLNVVSVSYRVITIGKVFIYSLPLCTV